MEINAIELKKNLGKVKLIDVREKEEYDEEHIAGSILIPMNTLTEERLEEEKITRKDEIVMYCRSGSRSSFTCRRMEMLGFKKVKSLDGGILAWKEKGLSIEI